LLKAIIDLSLSLMALIIKFMLLLSSETPSIFLNLFINHWVGLTGNFELLSIEYSKTKSLNVSTSNLLLASFLKGDNALLFSLKAFIHKVISGFCSVTLKKIFSISVSVLLGLVLNWVNSTSKEFPILLHKFNY
jgi:hypothetical protein